MTGDCGPECEEGKPYAAEEKRTHPEERVLNPALAVFGLGPLTHNAVRKTAHVAEFFLLELLLVFCFRGRTAVAFGTGYLAAFLDESIQLLSDRGAMIADVWIDLIGVSAGLLLGVVLLRGSRRTDGPGM